MSQVYTDFANGVRGLLLGLALGDTIGHHRGSLSDAPTLTGGVATQLAAFTTEGLIRVEVRARDRGLCHPVSVLWHAYARWGAIQGITPSGAAEHWSAASAESWPDGWLVEVPILAERRGSAPATVSALKQPRMGTVDEPLNGSAGAHALVRNLPAAAMTAVWSDEELVTQVRESAAITHGAFEAHWAAAAGASIVAGCLRGLPLPEALRACPLREMGDVLGHAEYDAHAHPRDPERLGTATQVPALAVLHDAIYVALCFPDPREAVKALEFAAVAPRGSSIAAVTGAVLGASNGSDVWPVRLVSRHELAWVLDTLARDLALQLTDDPSGNEQTAPRDPNWWHRYPGW